MNIKPFGKLTEIVDATEISIPLPSTLKALKALLEQRFPALALTPYAVAIDDELVSDEAHTILECTSIALMPPFSGG